MNTILTISLVFMTVTRVNSEARYSNDIMMVCKEVTKVSGTVRKVDIVFS